jgi:hypothetical protein
LLYDGTIEIEFAYRNGDEASSKPNAPLLQQPASGLFAPHVMPGLVPGIHAQTP